RYPTEGDGPFPVVMYLHGRHVTCSYAGQEFLSTGECDLEVPGVLGQPLNVIKPVENLKGYDYMANTLASHGYVVVSISANDVNDKDLAGDAGVNARSQLILHHLDILREINSNGQYSKLDDPYVMADLRGKIDMENIGLMGHSRGGQGVTHVLQLNAGDRGNYFELGVPEGGDFAAPHNLKAIFALAPTNFDYITAPDTTFAVLLPYCDGDVSNLQGAFMFDDSRFLDEAVPSRKFQVLTMGANHNFYNTIWTGDDYSNEDPHCDLGAEGNGRDAPLDQRRHGEFLMSSFFRLFLGGEQQFEPFWNGLETMPLDACPVGTENSPTARCDDRFHLSIQAKADERLLIDDIADDTSLSTNSLGGTTTPVDLDRFEFCNTQDTDGTVNSTACPSIRTWATAGQLYLESDNTNSSVTTVLGGLDVTDYDHLTFRVGVPVLTDANGALTSEPDLSVVLSDTSGQSVTLPVADYSKALYLPPGSPTNNEGAKTILNMVQLPLAAFEGLEFANLQSLTFSNTGDIKLQVAEIQLQALVGALVLPPEPPLPPANNPPVTPPVTPSEQPSQPPEQPAATPQQTSTSAAVTAGGGGGALGMLGLAGLVSLLAARRRTQKAN
ncbi:MAG: hypothetical protein R3194_09135, partial [Limnobacter sp.]|nr:hypothetical protein [Limnobacter sp.]